MANEKINWEKALQDYLIGRKSDGTIYTYKDIAEKYGVAEITVEEHGREEKWVELRRNTMEIAREMLPKKTGDMLAEINAQHDNLAKILIGKAVEALNEKDKDGNPRIKPRSFRDTREAIKDGVEIQRKVHGLDKPTVNNNIGQQNNFFTTEDLKRDMERRAAERTKVQQPVVSPAQPVEGQVIE